MDHANSNLLRDGFYKRLLDNLYDGVYFVDCNRRITYWNKGAERITGYTADQVIGKRCMDDILVHVDMLGQNLCQGNCPLQCAMKDGQLRETEAFLKHKSGYRVPIIIRTSILQDEDGKTLGGVEVFSDNSKMLNTQLQISRLEKDAITDSLTGLYNRRYLDFKLSMFLERLDDKSVGAAILFLDLDHYKAINDKYGHDAGDHVLQVVANTLRHNIRTTDIVGRWGGEEFIIFLPEINPEYLLAVANKIRILIQASTVLWKQKTIRVTTSIGGSMIQNGDSMAAILQRVDEMLYQSKNNGRNRVTLSE